MSKKKRILTGDRPTGPLHLGHYVGSLKNRVLLQDEYEQFILIADIQALTDNFENPQKIKNNILELALDYLSVEISPEKSTIIIQSQVPELAELTVYLMNMITVAQLERNPTVKNEIRQKGYRENVPVGFFVYPISQSADILGFQANLVPVGEDQLPMIEQSREIARRFNSLYGQTFVEPKEMLSEVPRLCGIDGKEKMSKSLNNTINLSDSADIVVEKVMRMYTDPTRVRATDPGHTEHNPVFIYLNAFHDDKKEIKDFEDRYRLGKVGDIEVKKRLVEILNSFLEPIRQKRKEYEKDSHLVNSILKRGTEKGRAVVEQTMTLVRKAVKTDYFG
ncbi:MAG: tryptophan--tRNA ligase [Patescibacteria group bacterium]|nr:tryptophan--tRNA ligase [Patescibacteria group bacterium]MDE1988209.1 tryptophan--tRNA ligase [Patescibacteria group bacterium]MDE2218186.1 tryptophan--tRNA ligase [Patescibacteria group bacterium]